MSVFAVIPARGGSKGVPRKNVRPLCGKPLIGWTIEAALAAEFVERVVVSSDDPEILEVSRCFGATVIERPSAISGDLCSSEAALEHALRQLQLTEGYLPELVAFLQCTSPLTAPEDIDGTIEALRREGADTALSVRDFHYFLWKQDDGKATGINHNQTVRQMRQERKAQYLETGAVYVMKTDGFLRNRHRFFGKTVLYEMPHERCLEIDDPVDFEIAEVLMRAKRRTLQESQLPDDIGAIVFDFDGVFTDNKVMVSQDGSESVLCDRGDGMGLEMLRKAGVPMLILSKETNPVVAARARKVGIEAIQSVEDKAVFLRRYCDERAIPLASVVYVGNDRNDRDCMKMVGCPVAVADAFPEVLSLSVIVLSHPGGRGAIRELAELILSHLAKRSQEKTLNEN